MTKFAAFLRSGTSLTVRAVVQVHRQLARLDMSVNLLLPVVHQGGRADDKSALRQHRDAVWTQKNKEIAKKKTKKQEELYNFI